MLHPIWNNVPKQYGVFVGGFENELVGEHVYGLFLLLFTHRQPTHKTLTFLRMANNDLSDDRENILSLE